MLKHCFYILTFLTICLLVACKPAVTPDQLYGRWKYTKIEIPTAPQYTDDAKSYLVDPTSIQFLKDSTVEIITPSQVQFRGHFTDDGYNLHVNGKYNDGSTAKMELWVMKLTKKEFVFKIDGQNPWIVTTVKNDGKW
jgi:hypothetical protein